MPAYRFTGRSEGKPVDGVINAPSTEAVVEQLFNRNIEPLLVEEIVSSSGEIELDFLVEWPNDDDKILFARQMFTLTKSGVSLVRSFQGLVESTHNKRLKQAMVRIIEDLQSGKELSTALAEHPRIFDRLFVRIVRMGEETGRMDESFKQLFQYMEVDKNTRRQIKSAMRYPTFVVLAIVIAMIVVNYFVIPKFTSMFSKLGSDLPVMTQILMSTSVFVKLYIGHILTALTLSITGFVQYIKTSGGRLWWDKIRLKLPIVGSIINRATLARYARAFSMGSRAGLPMIQILVAVEEAVDNAFMAQRILGMREGIERGESLTQAAYNSGLFTPLVLQMISVGEETGGMDEMMNEVAEFYEREVEYEVKGLSSAIEPILLTVIGGMVLVLALGIFMPMWDMGSAAMNKAKH
ncbi:MAG: type II secretion system F family protein [Magnetococcales bacterium]|nr:type II secretion system F family protein [Magnetococcales bacterium]NGZ06798.1 type II secretion system F family protein [Magnetococcales bacterium]